MLVKYPYVVYMYICIPWCNKDLFSSVTINTMHGSTDWDGKQPVYIYTIPTTGNQVQDYEEEDSLYRTRVLEQTRIL